MILELSKAVKLKNGLLVPAGTKFDGKTGKTVNGKHKLDRQLIPMQAIKGASGPFLNACVATMLTANTGFAQTYPDKKFEDWAHCIFLGDSIIVYVWDTRQVIDVIGGMHDAVKGGPIERTIVGKDSGERRHQILGWKKFGWAKSLYEMMMNPKWHRQDNGLPLVNTNKDWDAIITPFNDNINKKYSLENFDLLGFDAALERFDVGAYIKIEVENTFGGGFRSIAKGKVTKVGTFNQLKTEIAKQDKRLYERVMRDNTLFKGTTVYQLDGKSWYFMDKDIGMYAIAATEAYRPNDYNGDIVSKHIVWITGKDYKRQNMKTFSQKSQMPPEYARKAAEQYKSKLEADYKAGKIDFRQIGIEDIDV